MSENSTTDLPFGVELPSDLPRTALDTALNPDTSASRMIEIDVPVRDGIFLAADVYLPAADRLPAPAIVIGTPYDKTSPLEDGAWYRDGDYVAVVYDVRGRGKSEGEWHPHARDGLDGHDVVEWVAAQEWCNGDVGVAGTSYLGWVCWSTMAEHPPHLKAAVTTAPEGRWQQEIPYSYGCFWLGYAFWFSHVRRRITDSHRDVAALIDTLPVAAIDDVLEVAGPGWREMMEHDTLDDLFRSRRWDGEYDFDVPVLHVGGWHDHECVQGTLHHYQQMMATSPARERQWLLMGPWNHATSRFPTDVYEGVEAPRAGIDMTAVHLRFFDRFLKGEDNGVDSEPRVRMYDPGAREWKVREAWEGGTAAQELFLAEGGALADAPAAEGENTYRYDPLQPNGLHIDPNGPLWEPPIHLGGLEAQEGVLTWTSEPLAADLTVHGWGEIELYAASDREDTDWHVKLADVGPDDDPLGVAWGCLRASHGEDQSAPRAIVPGEVSRYSIELTPAFHTFRAGHRIRLLLASSEYPWFARNLNRFEPIAVQSEPLVATNTVHRGEAHPSCLRLRVED